MSLEFGSINLDRKDLGSFLPDLRSIKAFENLVKAVTEQIPDAINAAPQDVNTLLSVQSFTKSVSRAPDVRGDTYIDVTLDAQGFRLALVPERLVLALLPYLPRQAAASSSTSSAAVVDANLILATQIFGA